MNPILRNILAVIAGIIIGSLVNMALIIIGGNIIEAPGGCDMSTMSQQELMDCLKAAIPSFEFKHFVFPFLAHALGTLVGAFVAAKIAATKQKVFALVIGVWFLIGGIMNVASLGGPMSFNVVDIVLAYIPMAYLGWKFAGGKNESRYNSEPASSKIDEPS